MVRALGCGAGGSLGLLALIEEHSEAIEYDLIELGLRLDQLGTEKLTWRDLKVIVRHSPPDSALARAMYPDSHWTLTNQLHASVVDALNLLVWLQGSGKASTRPNPIPRPGVVAALVAPEDEPIGEAREMDEIDQLLNW